MNCFRFAARLAAFALAAAAPGAQAATLTVDIPGCTAVALTGTAPNYQINCTQQVQACTVLSTPTNPNGGTEVTLIAACNPSAAAVTWQPSRDCTTPTVQAGQPLTAKVIEPTGGRSCVYTAVADAGGSGATTVVWQGPGTLPPPNAPTGCSISRTPAGGTLPATGGAVTLSATCSGGGAVTSWSWRKNATAGWSTLQAPGETLPANTGTALLTYTYGVTACAGSACATEVATTFTVAGSQPVGQCGQFTDVINLELPWGGLIDTYSNGSMRPDTVVVARLVVPLGAVTPSVGQGRLSWVEYDGQGYFRQATLSTQPCDFRGWTANDYPTDPTGANFPLKWGIGQTGDIGWGLQGGTGAPPLVPGNTYYFNIRNKHPSTGNVSCDASRCDIRLTNSLFK